MRSAMLICCWAVMPCLGADEPTEPTAAKSEKSASSAKTEPAASKPRTLGIFLYEKFELLDVAGPAEVFGNLKGKLRLVTIADKAGPIRSTQGVVMKADYGLDDAPPLDFLLVPGGVGTISQISNKRLLTWLAERAPKAEITMSVCSGSAILAKAGLLDGRRATTNKQLYRRITPLGPKVNWVKEARWVDEGAIVTSSGVSAGIDMSLHVVERLYGKSVAQAIADGTEYEWHSDATWDPFARFAK